MHKKICFLFILSLCIFLNYIYYSDYEKKVLENDIIESKNIDNMFAMMYEIGAETGEYEVSSDLKWMTEGYKFNEQLSKCENGGQLSWNSENKSIIFNTNISDKCYIYFDKIPTIIDKCAGQNMASCMATNYSLDENLYYHNANLLNGANDNSYRYSGANPNNYVCFGSDESPCPNENLYRIIGIFDGKIKIVKSTTYVSSYWGGTYSTDNNWANSTLNTETLNSNFFNSFPETWRNKISISNWCVGGFTNGTKWENAANMYNTEVRNSSSQYETYVGLIYVSDYGFAVSPDYWNLAVANYNTEEVRSKNWIFDNGLQWTISKQSDSSGHAFFIDGSGLVFGDSINVYNIPVKPTFYLNSNINLISGTGSKNDPYIIN